MDVWNVLEDAPSDAPWHEWMLMNHEEMYVMHTASEHNNQTCRFSLMDQMIHPHKPTQHTHTRNNHISFMIQPHCLKNPWYKPSCHNFDFIQHSKLGAFRTANEAVERNKIYNWATLLVASLVWSPSSYNLIKSVISTGSCDCYETSSQSNSWSWATMSTMNSIIWYPCALCQELSIAPNHAAAIKVKSSCTIWRIGFPDPICTQTLHLCFQREKNKVSGFGWLDFDINDHHDCRTLQASVNICDLCFVTLQSECDIWRVSFNISSYHPAIISMWTSVATFDICVKVPQRHHVVSPLAGETRETKMLPQSYLAWNNRTNTHTQTGQTQTCSTDQSSI